MKRIGCKGLCWLLTLLSLACLFGCAGEGSPTPEATQAAVTWDTLEFDRSMELLYADQFSVDYDQGGYAKLTIGDADTYLVAKNREIPAQSSVVRSTESSRGSPLALV